MNFPYPPTSSTTFAIPTASASPGAQTAPIPPHTSQVKPIAMIISEPPADRPRITRADPEVENVTKKFMVMAIDSQEQLSERVEIMATIFRNPESLALDSGAAVHVVPLDYASDYPLLPLTDDMSSQHLVSAEGSEIYRYGRRDVFLEFAPGLILMVRVIVGNVRFPILSLRALQRVYGIDATFRSDGTYSLHHPDVEDQIPFADEGGVYSLTPYRRIPYNQIVNAIQTTYLDGRMPIAPVGNPGTGRTDFWKRDNRNLEIIRVHKRMRRRLFLSEGRSLTDIPVPIDELSTKRESRSLSSRMARS